MGGLGVTANGYRVSFGGDKNILELYIVVLIEGPSL